MKVLIDPGHGGKDSGAFGNNLNEKDIALAVALKVGEVLKRHKVDVIYSRIKDEFIELSERARIANSDKVDAFVSLHCNSSTDSNVQGIEVFSYPGSNIGSELSLLILNNMVREKVYTRVRGTKTANYAVLRLTKIPAVLVELGFISNAEDARILINKQDALAASVSKGILSFLGIPYREIDSNVKDYNDAVDVLVKAKIISNPQAWQGNNINVNNVAPLIIKMASYITNK